MGDRDLDVVLASSLNLAERRTGSMAGAQCGYKMRTLIVYLLVAFRFRISTQLDTQIIALSMIVVVFVDAAGEDGALPLTSSVFVAHACARVCI